MVWSQLPAPGRSYVCVLGRARRAAGMRDTHRQPCLGARRFPHPDRLQECGNAHNAVSLVCFEGRQVLCLWGLREASWVRWLGPGALDASEAAGWMPALPKAARCRLAGLHPGANRSHAALRGTAAAAGGWAWRSSSSSSSSSGSWRVGVAQQQRQAQQRASVRPCLPATVLPINYSHQLLLLNGRNRLNRAQPANNGREQPRSRDCSQGRTAAALPTREPGEQRCGRQGAVPGARAAQRPARPAGAARPPGSLEG